MDVDNTMKKTTTILVALILIGSILPIAYADNSNNNPNDEYIDKETQHQTEIMNNNTLGAQIRLLQLEKAIIKNIEKGEQILSIINNSEFNLTKLEVIIAEFYLLKQEVQRSDPNATNAVKTFVDLKHDAVNLTKEFRETLRSTINTTTYNQLQQQTRNMTCNQTQNLTKQIQSKIRQYNTKQFRSLYKILGENNPEKLTNYQNGTLTQLQLKQNLTKKIQQNKTTNQYEFLTSLKQQKIQQKIQTQNNIQNATNGFKQRQKHRLQNRINQSENLSDNPLYQQLTKRLQQKLGTLNNNNGGNNDDNGSGQGHQGNGSDNNQNNDEPGSDDPGSGGGNGQHNNDNNPGPGGGT